MVAAEERLQSGGLSDESRLWGEVPGEPVIGVIRAQISVSDFWPWITGNKGQIYDCVEEVKQEMTMIKGKVMTQIWPELSGVTWCDQQKSELEQKDGRCADLNVYCLRNWKSSQSSEKRPSAIKRCLSLNLCLCLWGFNFDLCLDQSSTSLGNKWTSFLPRVLNSTDADPQPLWSKPKLISGLNHIKEKEKLTKS